MKACTAGSGLFAKADCNWMTDLMIRLASGVCSGGSTPASLSTANTAMAAPTKVLDALPGASSASPHASCNATIDPPTVSVHINPTAPTRDDPSGRPDLV